MKLNYPGVPVYFNGQNYYIPSLSTRAFRENYDLLTKEEAGETAVQSFERFIPVIGLAIRRNYPEIDNAFLDEHLDLHTFRQAIAAVQNASGLSPVTEGE